MNKSLSTVILAAVAFFLLPSIALAAGGGDASLPPIDHTRHWLGYTCLAIFVVSYALVMSEEFIHLRKSKPALLAAGLIWALIAGVGQTTGHADAINAAVRHNILEYAELMLFLLVAMTYINAMAERNVFNALRSFLVRKEYSFRQLFWITGVLSFFISPIADNLTTALVMCAVVLAVGGDNKKFIGIACVNIVVAANAGGAFSPFGDITTLMVWQKGIVQFKEFLVLFFPSVVNYIIPAFIMSFFVPKVQPHSDGEEIKMKLGAKRTIVLFLLTIWTAVCFHNFLHLPPMVGMMAGLAYLQFFGFYLKMQGKKAIARNAPEEELNHIMADYSEGPSMGAPGQYDIFKKVAGAEWDTLLFFYGIILAVGGLGYIGYLAGVSEFMYGQMGPTFANVMVGILSAIVDNIPVMFAVLTMQPDMSLNQWLLVTLTAGVGGSMLSIGSAAGVALMGQAHGKYTFFGHLKWAPVIALGYVASIYAHIWINGLA